MKGARAVGRHFDPAPARHGPGRVIAAAQGLGGANAAPKWWVFVPVPEERTKREPFCSAPPTTKLQAKPGVGRRRLPSGRGEDSEASFRFVCADEVAPRLPAARGMAGESGVRIVCGGAPRELWIADGVYAASEAEQRPNRLGPVGRREHPGALLPGNAGPAGWGNLFPVPL